MISGEVSGPSNEGISRTNVRLKNQMGHLASILKGLFRLGHLIEAGMDEKGDKTTQPSSDPSSLSCVSIHSTKWSGWVS